MLWLVLACRPAADTGRETPAPYRVVWADLHAHTNLSMDGCEAPDAGCRPRSTPAADALQNAVEAGLDVVALTDHAEFLEHQDLASGVVTNIWDATRTEVDAAPDGLVAFAGYEWTAHCAGAQNIHRTVVLEDPSACDAWRAPSCVLPARKEQLGHEVYTENPSAKISHSDALQLWMDDVPSVEGCSDTRWIGFVHHPGLTTPAGVDWANPGPLLARELLVEIYSEHGSSECRELDGDCAWEVNTAFHAPEGSIHAMLAEGHRMGFLAGTDSHDGRPGSIDAPGPSGQYVDTDDDGLADSVTLHHSRGGITGILLLPGEPLDRATVFDALEDRRTVATSHPFDPMVIALEPGVLPGREVDEGTWPLRIELPEGATWEWVTPDGAVLAEPAELDLDAGDVGYIRVRATVDGVEHRAWASPWWVSDAPR